MVALLQEYLSDVNNTTERFFEPYQYVKGNGESLHIGVDSKITALLLLPDTELETKDTIYGKTAFIQLVGITETEINAILEDRNTIQIILENMKKDNPYLVTDMMRTKSYI